MICNWYFVKIKYNISTYRMPWLIYKYVIICIILITMIISDKINYLFLFDYSKYVKNIHQISTNDTFIFVFKKTYYWKKVTDNIPYYNNYKSMNSLYTK